REPRVLALRGAAAQVVGARPAPRPPVPAALQSGTGLGSRLAGQQRHLVSAEMINAYAERRVRHRDLRSFVLGVFARPEQQRHRGLPSLPRTLYFERK